MNELYHHGIKGMKWGVRRYQNPDGSLTADGKRRRNIAIALSPGGYVLYKGAKAIKKRYDKRKEIANYTDQQKHDIAMDVKSSAKETYKYRKYMSDKELNYRINRLYGEKRLKDLVRDEDDTYKYKQAATNILASYGTMKASAAVLGPEATAYVAASHIINAPKQTVQYQKQNDNNAYVNYIKSENRNSGTTAKKKNKR